MPVFVFIQRLSPLNVCSQSANSWRTCGRVWERVGRRVCVGILFALLAVSLVSKEAYAQGAPSGGGSLLQGLMPLLLIVVVMYFLLVRPQQKRQRLHRELVNSLKRGDKVLTNGGFYAVVSRSIDERDIEVELAGKLKVKMLRSSVLELVTNPPPAKRR